MKLPVFLNSASNIIDFITNVIITFVMTPIYLSTLGRHDYGIWELISVVVGYAGLLDLGTRAAVTRYAAVYKSTGKKRELSILYSTALTHMSLVGLLVLTGFYIWSQVNPEALTETNSEVVRYETLLMLVGCSAFLSFIKNTSEGMIEGLQKYVIKNLFNILIKISTAVYLWLNLTENNALILLIQVVIMGTVIRILVFNCMLVFGEDSLRLFIRPKLKVFYEIFSFGFKSLINGVAHTIEQSVGLVLIGVLLNPAAIPLYSIPRSLTRYIGTFIRTASTVLLPYFTELSEDNKTQELKNSFLFASKVILWFLITSTSFLVFFGEDFIHLWLGEQFESSDLKTIIVLLCLASLIERLNPLGLRLSAAKNRHGYFAKLKPIAAMLSIILSYFLIIKYGVEGAVIANILVAIVFTPLFVKYSFSLIALSWPVYWSLSIKPNLWTIALLATYSQLYQSMGIKQDFLNFTILFATFSMVSLVVLYSLVLTEQERSRTISIIWRHKDRHI